MTAEQKAWIDAATYRQMLERWRFAPIGDPMFIDDTGAYFEKVFKQKREATSDTERVAASKSIGWDR